MRALSYRGPGLVRVLDKPVPRIEHPEDAIVRVTRAAICGSDLHLFHGLVPDTRVGHTFGHEFTGVVESVGEQVANLKPGDRVVVPFNISCGRCFYCARGLTGLCENSNPNADVASGVFGYSHTTGGYDGGQAEFVRVPFADFGPMKIPDDLDDESVLFLSDILPTGYQAAEMGDIQEGETVIVFGAGPVGIFAAKAAQLMGAGRVICVDEYDYRLEFVKRYCNAETVNFRECDDVIAVLLKMTGMHGADVCIDAVGCEARGDALHSFMGALKLEAGRATGLDWAIEAVRKGGRVSIIGAYGPPANLVAIGTAMNKGITIRTNQCNVKRYMPHLLDLIRGGRIDAKAIITHRFPLEDAPEAYRTFARKRDNVIKCVLIPNSH